MSGHEQLPFDGMPEPLQTRLFEPIQMHDSGSNRQVSLECACTLFAASMPSHPRSSEEMAEARGRVSKDVLGLAEEFLAWLERE